MMRIAIAGAALASAILLDFGAVAQTGDTMSPLPGAAPTPPPPVRPLRRPMPQPKPPADASATQAPADVANQPGLDKPVAVTPKQAELLRKAEQIDRKVMRSICIGC
jgi:hypothetical protein